MSESGTTWDDVLTASSPTSQGTLPEPSSKPGKKAKSVGWDDVLSAATSKPAPQPQAAPAPAPSLWDRIISSVRGASDQSQSPPVPLADHQNKIPTGSPVPNASP